MEETNNIVDKTKVPTNILLDPVHPSNGWEIILLEKENCRVFIIKKGYYYYELNSTAYFKNCRFTSRPVQSMNDLDCFLGEYKPLVSDNQFLTILPIQIQGNEFIINSRTNIVYLKPKNIVVGFPKTNKYRLEDISSYYFGGIFNNYAHSENHTNQYFINVVPSTKKPQNNPYLVKNIPNEFGKQYFNKLDYDKSQLEKSLLGDKTLLMNPYTVMNKPQKFAIESKEGVKKIERITIIIPFLDNYTNNLEQLEKTLKSLIEYMENCDIFIVTNLEHFEINSDIMKKIQVIKNYSYVGNLGQENRLNNLMRNGYDVANFYNYIISTLVKNDTYIIWNYNWELYDKWNILEHNLAVPIYNYYIYNETIYKSKNYIYCYILDSHKRYYTTPDLMFVYPNINKTMLSLLVPVKNIYSITDYEIEKHKITTVINNELKHFYENILENKIPDYILADS